MEKILIVVDMQKDFVDGSLGSKEAQAIVPDVIQKIKDVKAYDGKVIFTKDTHFENYLNTEEGKNLPVEHCIKGTDGWEIIDELKPFVRDKGYNGFGIKPVYEKKTFGCKELAEDFTKDMDFNYPYVCEIEIVGLCTDICVISNALLLKAYEPEVKITVDAKCCAGVTPEAHDAALKAMKSCQINVINEGKEAWRNN